MSNPKENRPQGDRPPPVWKDLQTVTLAHTDLAIRIQVSEGGRAQYSYEFGRMRDGKFLRFIRAALNVQGGKVSLQGLDMDALEDVLVAAEDVIEADAQQRENAFQAARQPPERQGKDHRNRN